MLYKQTIKTGISYILYLKQAASILSKECKEMSGNHLKWFNLTPPIQKSLSLIPPLWEKEKDLDYKTLDKVLSWNCFSPGSWWENLEQKPIFLFTLFPNIFPSGWFILSTLPDQLKSQFRKSNSQRESAFETSQFLQIFFNRFFRWMKIRV